MLHHTNQAAVLMHEHIPRIRVVISLVVCVLIFLSHANADTIQTSAIVGNSVPAIINLSSIVFAASNDTLSDDNNASNSLGGGRGGRASNENFSNNEIASSDTKSTFESLPQITRVTSTNANEVIIIENSSEPEKVKASPGFDTGLVILVIIILSFFKHRRV